MRAVADRSRRIWALSGLITAAALAIPGARLVASAGQVSNPPSAAPPSVTRTVTVPQPVTTVTVLSYGAPVQVTAGSVRRVQATETSSPLPGGGPVPVTQSVSGGHLLLADPACSPAGLPCSVTFTLVVPSGVTVTAVTDGAPLTVSGVAGANLDSGGGLVRATRIAGLLTVRTGGGALLLDGLAGPLEADTYGGPESVRIPTDPAARRLITVSTGSGPLQIGPPPPG